MRAVHHKAFEAEDLLEENLTLILISCIMVNVGVKLFLSIGCIHAYDHTGMNLMRALNEIEEGSSWELTQ